MYIAWQVLQSRRAVLFLMLLLSLAAIILPVFFLVMTHGLPQKKKGTKFSRLAKPLMPNMKKNKQSCLTELKLSTKTNWPKKISHTTPTTLTNSTTGCTSMSCSRCPANQSSLSSTSPALYKIKAS